MIKKIFFIFTIIILLGFNKAFADTIPPAASFIPFNLNMTTDNTPTLTGIATDEESIITSIECRIDGGAFTPATVGILDSSTEAFSFKSPIALVRGIILHTAEVKCTDSANNVDSTNFASYSFYVVGDRPEIVITSGGEKIISGDPVDLSPSFEVKVISNKGLTVYPLRAFIDNIFQENLTKVVDADNLGIITALYNPTLLDGTHSLKVDMTDNLGNITTREVIGLVVQSGQEISLQGDPLSFPNPYNGVGNVNLSYVLSKDSNVALTIYDLMGNQLSKRNYSNGQNGGKAGYNEVTWDGKTTGGADLGNGIYIYLIVADGKVAGKGKLTIVR